MAADSSVDAQFDWLFSWLISPIRLLAVHALPATLAAYVYGMELWARCVVQFNRTFTAIVDSFYTDVIHFYDENGKFYPFATVLRDKYHLFLKYYEWSYDVHKKQFIHNSADERDVSKHRIPYLGASLTYEDPDFLELSQGSITVGDLSEWIADQTILASTNKVPLQVLVIAWAYCNRIPLIFGLKGYVLTVMNEDGDEIEYPLTLIEEQESPSTSSSMSIASSPEVEQGNIQIISQRILPQSLYDLLVPTAPTNTPLPASPETVSSEENDTRKKNE